jgi:hypothetical protein
MRIDTMDDWLKAASRLSERGYILWQTQFDIDSPDGFIARFMTPDDKQRRLEIVTKDASVRDAMLRYKPED